MKISHKGLYALQALMTLARHHQRRSLTIQEIASDSDLPKKFLEAILVQLRNARLVESTRGTKGGYQLRRSSSEIQLSEVVRLIDGPLSPFGDAKELQGLILKDTYHRGLYQTLLNVRNAAADILETTTLADIVKSSDASRLRVKKPHAGRS